MEHIVQEKDARRYCHVFVIDTGVVSREIADQATLHPTGVNVAYAAEGLNAQSPAAAHGLHNLLRQPQALGIITSVRFARGNMLYTCLPPGR